MLALVLAISALAATPCGSEATFPLLRRHQEADQAAPDPTAAGPADDDSSAPAPPPVAKPVVAKAVRLPPVSSVLSSATKTMKTLSSEVNQLHERLVSIQQQDEHKLADKKLDFEQRLDTQELRSRAVNSTNLQIATEIAQLRARNANVRKHSSQLQQGNKLMRKELGDIQARLGAARQFITASLGRTDDSHAKELAVLQVANRAVPPPAPKKPLAHAHVDSDDSDDDDDSDDGDDDDKATSLMEISSESTRVTNPATDGESVTLISTLNRGLAELASEEKRGSERLDREFHSQFQAGRVKRAQLLATQRRLNATRASLRSEGVKLDKAASHLDKTRQHLEQRLRSAGAYLQRLGHLLLAPPGEAQGLIEQIPKAVPLQ